MPGIDIAIDFLKLLGNIASRRDEPWKAPTGDWIEHLFHKKYGERPAEWPAPLREEN